MTSYGDALRQIQALPTHSEMEDISEVQLGDNVNGPSKSLRERLYNGAIRYQIKLGSLKTALQQMNGIVSTEPRFMETFHQHALECTWRLSRWVSVSELLQSDKNKFSAICSRVPKNAPKDSKELDQLLSFPSFLSLSNSCEDKANLQLAQILHSIHMNDAEALSLNLTAARLEIMVPLADALDESYNSAYPYIHRLHLLHEAEDGFVALRKISDVSNETGRAELWKSQCNWESRYNLLAKATGSEIRFLLYGEFCLLKRTS